MNNMNTEWLKQLDHPNPKAEYKVTPELFSDVLKNMKNNGHFHFNSDVDQLYTLCSLGG